MFTYDLTGIKDYEKFCFAQKDGKDALSNVTSYIVWGMYAINMNAITETTAAEVYARMKVGHAFWARAGTPSITPLDIQRHIGLTTNAEPWSRSEWLKFCKDKIKRDLEGYESEARRVWTDPTLLTASYIPI